MLIGIRRAIVLLILAFFALQLGMTAIIGPPELSAAMTGLTLCYLLAFFGVAAEWFWARWFAMGLGNFGSLMLLVLFKTGYEPIFAAVGGAHLMVMLLLCGEGMAAHYEYSPRAQERYNLEQESLSTLRRAVKSAGSTLPILILYGLGPGQDGALAPLSLGLGALGVLGLLRQRAWCLPLLGLAGAAALVQGLWGSSSNSALLLSAAPGTPVQLLFGDTASSHLLMSGCSAWFAASLLLIPLLYAGPLLRVLRGR